MYSVYAKRIAEKEDTSKKMVEIHFSGYLENSSSECYMEFQNPNDNRYYYRLIKPSTGDKEYFNDTIYAPLTNKVSVAWTDNGTNSDFAVSLKLIDYDEDLINYHNKGLGSSNSSIIYMASHQNYINNRNMITREVKSTLNNYVYKILAYDVTLNPEKISGEEICIYNDQLLTDDVKLQSPKLDLVENGAGTFSMKVPPTNVGYDVIERLITEIIVKRDGEEIWSGRVLTIKEDFQKNRTMTCEGELAYLNDTVQPQQLYDDMTVSNWLKKLLEVHNSRISSDKQFTLGYVSAGLDVELEEPYTNYENTLAAISAIVNNGDGYLNFRKENGVRYLDYISDETRPTASQEIRFASNLLDFTKSYDSTEFCTAILPLGERLENSYGISMSGIDGVDAYVTVEPVNNNDPYVSIPEAVEEFGWICKKVEFDTNDEDELLEWAKEYLTSTQFDNLVLEANAVDLSYLDVDSGKFNLSDSVHVISKPHGMDTYLKLTKISIPLDNPGNTSYTLGNEVKNSLSAKNASANFTFEDYLKNKLGDGSLINIAKTRAEWIVNNHTTGYFTVTTDDKGSNEVYFTNTRINEGYDPENPAGNSNKYWRWNLGALEYVNTADDVYQDGKRVHQPRLALTEEGEIVADVVSTGKLQDHNGNFYLDMKTGDLKMKNGEFSGNITGSTITGSTFQTAGDNSKLVLRDGSIYGYYNNTQYGTIKIGTGTYYSKDQGSISYTGISIDSSADIFMKGKKLTLDISDGIYVRDANYGYWTHKCETDAYADFLTKDAYIGDAKDFVYNMSVNYNMALHEIRNYDGYSEYVWESFAQTIGWDSSKPWLVAKNKRLQVINGLVTELYGS